MSGCGNCCGSCGGCGSSMELTAGEIALLQELAQIPFLPVARQLGDDTPVCLEEGPWNREECSLILQCLQKRGLISIDYDKPLRGFDHAAYAAYPIRGSFALTERGQLVLELLEWQGALE